MTMMYLQMRMTIMYITMMLNFNVNGDVVDDDVDNHRVNDLFLLIMYAHTDQHCCHYDVRPAM